MKNDRALIRRINLLHQAVGATFGAMNLALQQGIEAPLHVAGGERTAVAELHAFVQMKDVCLGIGNLPALCESRFYAQVLVTGEKIIEQQSIDTFGLRIESYARIKVCGTRLDNHHQSAGIRLARARQ